MSFLLKFGGGPTVRVAADEDGTGQQTFRFNVENDDVYDESGEGKMNYGGAEDAAEEDEAGEEEEEEEEAGEEEEEEDEAGEEEEEEDEAGEEEEEEEEAEAAGEEEEEEAEAAGDEEEEEAEAAGEEEEEEAEAAGEEEEEEAEAAGEEEEEKGDEVGVGKVQEMVFGVGEEDENRYDETVDDAEEEYGAKVGGRTAGQPVFETQYRISGIFGVDEMRPYYLYANVPTFISNKEAVKHNLQLLQDSKLEYLSHMFNRLFKETPLLDVYKTYTDSRNHLRIHVEVFTTEDGGARHTEQRRSEYQVKLAEELQKLFPDVVFTLRRHPRTYPNIVYKLRNLPNQYPEDSGKIQISVEQFIRDQKITIPQLMKIAKELNESLHRWPVEGFSISSSEDMEKLRNFAEKTAHPGKIYVRQDKECPKRAIAIHFDKVKCAIESGDSKYTFMSEDEIVVSAVATKANNQTNVIIFKAPTNGKFTDGGAATLNAYVHLDI